MPEHNYFACLIWKIAVLPRMFVGLALLLAVAACGRDLLAPVGKTITLETSADFETVTVAGTLVLHGWDTALHAQSLTVAPGGVLTHDGPVRSAETASRIVITCRGTLSVAAGGRIDANGKGYAGGTGQARNEDPASAGYGPGAGGYPKLFGASAGGSHGGRGGTPSAKDVTDVPDAPVQPGSGGGGGKGTGGAGGGVISLTAQSLCIDGAVSANGSDSAGYSWSAGGAGGSIVLRADTIAGRGLVTANGGSGTLYAGGGGGGRIAVTGHGRSDIRSRLPAGPTASVSRALSS